MSTTFAPRQTRPTRRTGDVGADTERADVDRPGDPARLAAPGRVGVVRWRVGVAVGTVGGLAWAGAFAWWITHVTVAVVPLLWLCFGLATAAVGMTVTIGLGVASRRTAPRSRPVEADAASRYACAVADVVGRTRAGDLHRDVRVVVRAARRSIRRSTADYAMAAVLVDGAVRLGAILTVAVGLLLGASPLPSVSPVAGVLFAAGVVATSVAHVLLSGGRIRIGDRVRWTFSSLGEVVAREDVAGVPPRRWVGAMATVVGLNVAVALRGMSDRWTHGLRPMSDDDRMIAMLIALGFVLGALYTLATTERPSADDAHLVSRRLEERTARQSVLGAAVCVGLIGLIAGILPGSVDAADHDPGRVERTEQRDPVGTDRG